MIAPVSQMATLKVPSKMTVSTIWMLRPTIWASEVPVPKMAQTSRMTTAELCPPGACLLLCEVSDLEGTISESPVLGILDTQFNILEPQSQGCEIHHGAGPFFKR